jgi:hypothetical protein
MILLFFFGAKGIFFRFAAYLIVYAPTSHPSFQQLFAGEQIGNGMKATFDFFKAVFVIEK